MALKAQLKRLQLAWEEANPASMGLVLRRRRAESRWSGWESRARGGLGRREAERRTWSVADVAL